MMTSFQVQNLNKEKKEKTQSLLQRFLDKFTLILAGVFSTTLLFALSMQVIPNKNGIWLGLFLSLATIALSFYFGRPGTKLRFITWAILTTIIFGAALFFFLTTSLQNIWEGV